MYLAVIWPDGLLGYSDYQHDTLSVIVMPVKYLTNDLSLVRCYILRHRRGKKSGYLQFLRLGSPQQLFLSQKLFLDRFLCLEFLIEYSYTNPYIFIDFLIIFVLFETM